MKTFDEWKLFENLKHITENTSLSMWVKENMQINEASTNTRYSVEVNFRTKVKEVLDGYAKICLGYVSAAIKQNGYHVKQVYDQKPIRILVSSRNWDDGENVGIVYYHPDYEGGCFIIGHGFYNKDVKTISLNQKKKCGGDSAAEVTTELRNLMHELKNKKDRHKTPLKGISLKRGPKG